jgi:transcriptional regulator with XRE-family HTH domain
LKIFFGCDALATFSERLKELRKEKAVTQKQVADVIGIAERNYRRYEADLVDPIASVVSKLSDYFGVSIDYLLGRVNFWHDAEGHITVTVPPDLKISEPKTDE